MRWLFLSTMLLLAAALIAEGLIYRAIRLQSSRNEAAPADAIVVFGAAEYDGQPSPVFKARLDHAFDLQQLGLAPLVITTGGGGGDRRYTEAGVGRDYLIQQGLAADKIVTDAASETTYQSAAAVERILVSRGAHTCIAVSDGFHLFRVKLLLTERGIRTYASPAPNSPIESDAWERTLHSWREVMIVTAWYLGYKG